MAHPFSLPCESSQGAGLVLSCPQFSGVGGGGGFGIWVGASVGSSSGVARGGTGVEVGKDGMGVISCTSVLVLVIAGFRVGFLVGVTVGGFREENTKGSVGVGLRLKSKSRVGVDLRTKSKGTKSPSGPDSW